MDPDPRGPGHAPALVADVEKDRINGRWEASEDQGETWRTDYELTLERGT
jgi:hypothetical protein